MIFFLNNNNNVFKHGKKTIKTAIGQKKSKLRALQLLLFG